MGAGRWWRGVARRGVAAGEARTRLGGAPSTRRARLRRVGRGNPNPNPSPNPNSNPNPNPNPNPSFRFSRDEDSGQTVIEGMGELHLEIICDRMKREFNVECTIGPPQVAYREP